MARRTLLKPQDRQELFDVPTDEDSLIRHYSLSPADRLEIEIRRREHNRLGFAVQLCLMRYPGRPLLPNETPPKAEVKGCWFVRDVEKEIVYKGLRELPLRLPPYRFSA